MIYICIPCHDEERTVGVLLWKIRQVMADFPRDYQILVLDDASTDATRAVIERYMRVLPLTLARHASRRGYGASVEALLREAVRRAPYPKRDVAITLQADFTDDPEHIPALIKRIEAGADVVIASSTPADAEAPRGWRWATRVLRPVLRRPRWWREIEDPLSGYRAYRIITLRRALEGRNGTALVRTDGWATNVELLRAVMPHVRRADAVPAAPRHTRRQRGSRFDAWRVVREVLRYVWSELRGRPLPERAHAPPEIVARRESPAPVRRGPETEPARQRARGRGRGARSDGDGAQRRDRERGERGEQAARAERSGDERQRRPRRANAAQPAAVSTDAATPPEGDAQQPAPKKRRRRRSGGRRRRGSAAAQNAASQQSGESAPAPENSATPAAPAES